MVLKTVIFLFFTILLVTTKVSTREFENEDVKELKTSTPNDVQTPPLPVNKVYDDEKESGFDRFFNWITDHILPKPKPETPVNPTPNMPQNPMPTLSPPLNTAPPPLENDDEDDGGQTPSSPSQDNLPAVTSPIVIKQPSFGHGIGGKYGRGFGDCKTGPCRNRP